jgi:hypothetical protein
LRQRTEHRFLQAFVFFDVPQKGYQIGNRDVFNGRSDRGRLPLSYSRKLVHVRDRMTCDRAAPNPAVIEPRHRGHARARTRFSVNIWKHSRF